MKKLFGIPGNALDNESTFVAAAIASAVGLGLFSRWVG
jgi:hypothetical protein